MRSISEFQKGKIGDVRPENLKAFFIGGIFAD